jgi:Xaa-Pro aminopeptidase
VESKVYKKRQQKLHGFLKENNLDGIIVFGFDNIFYLTGFEGDGGFYFQDNKKSCLFVNPLYISQAKSEITSCEVIEYKNLENSLFDVLKSPSAKTIGFDSNHITFFQTEKIKEKLKDSNTTLFSISEELEFLREIKEKKEIDLMKKAIEYAEKGYRKTLPLFLPGTKERDLAIEMEYQIKKSGADDLAFDIIIISGKKSAFPHGVANTKKIEKGDLVIIDFGATSHGYKSDQTCTITIGTPKKKQKEIYNIVKDAQSLAIEALKPGIEIKKIDEITRDYLESHGYGKYIFHPTGHGIGINVHESPKIEKSQKGHIKEGMVITIEPGIYIPDWGGIRVEDMLLVKDDFCEILTNINKNKLKYIN